MADSFWDRRAFSIVGRNFAWIDVVFAAMARGEWAAFERRLAERPRLRGARRRRRRVAVG
jgi:hypothetical protein